MQATKKASKKESESTVKSQKAISAEKYFTGVGRRKSSIARAKIYISSKKAEGKVEPEIIINDKPYKDYFSLSELREIVVSPLKIVSPEMIEKISITVRGGGIRGQAESARLGIARALVAENQGYRKIFKDLGYLTRNARVVERKKAGLKKARRAPQFSKR